MKEMRLMMVAMIAAVVLMGYTPKDEPIYDECGHEFVHEAPEMEPVPEMGEYEFFSLLDQTTGTFKAQ